MTDLGTGGGGGRATAAPVRAARIPWVPVLLLAALGTLAATAFTLYDASATRAQNGWLLHVGPTHPSRALIERDFPEEPVSERGSHDGAQFYAIALDPWHPQQQAQYLDRPRYRLQRPLFPIVSWVAHPTGGGPGLLWTMFGIGVLGIFLGGVATGALSATLRGPPLLALVFPLLPGVVLSLRITLPDALATALVLVAIVLSLRRHDRWAVAAAVAAVLTKEPTFLVLAGFGLWRRDRTALALVGIPAAVAGIWAVWLFFNVPAGVDGGSLSDITLPFRGLVESVQYWATGDSPLALISVVAAVGVGVAALVRRGLRHPLGWAILVNIAWLAVLSKDVIGLERGGPRTTLPLLVLGLVALVAPGLRDAPPRRSSRELASPQTRR